MQYHSPTDTPANLDRSSLQHHGDNLLRLAQVFGEQQLPLPRGDEVTFFSLLGRLVWYPAGLTVPLALLALGLLAGTLWYARRHGARLWRVAIAAATVPLLLAAAGGLGVAVWWALGRLRPAYQSLDWGSTYRPEWYEAGLTVLAVTAAVAWYLLVRRRLSSVETMLGLLAWLVGSAVAVAVLSPEVAAVPAIGVLLALLLLAFGFRIDVLDAEHPGQTSLAYTIDTNQGTAVWLSADAVLAPWTQQYITNQGIDVGDQFPGPLARARHAGPAPLWPVPPPEVIVTGTEQQGDYRVVQLHITGGGARRLAVAAATVGQHITATVDDLAVVGAPPKPQTGRWNGQ